MRSRASAPPTPPKPSAGGSRPPTPKPGPPAPPPHPAPPTTTTPGRGRTRAREGQGTPRTTQARGHGRAPSEGRHTQGQEGTGTGTKTRRKRAPRQPQRTRDQGTGPQGGQPHGPSRDHTMGYKGRAALPSRFDAEYCYGGLISAGLTSVRASVTNLLRPVEKWHCGGAPIPSMMNIEHRKGKRNAVIDREGFGAAGRCPPSTPSPSAVKTGSTKNTTDAPDPSSPAPEIWTSP